MGEQHLLKWCRTCQRDTLRGDYGVCPGHEERRGHVVEGRRASDPDADPIRILINPGSATSGEIAELLSSISVLRVTMGGERVSWTVPKPENNNG